MAHHIDWDNISQHIHDNDARYKRRLRRKQLYITCSPSLTNVVSPADSSSLKKLKTVKDGNFMGNHEVVVACPNVVSDLKPIRANLDGKRNDVGPDMEMFNEGFRVDMRSLVCKVDGNVSDDVSLKKLRNVQDGNFLRCDDFWVECSNVVGNSEPTVGNCATRGNLVVSDVKMFKEDLEVECGTRENIVDPDFKRFKEDLEVECATGGIVVDPDYKMFMENLKVDGDSFVLVVKHNEGLSEVLKYEKDVLPMEYKRKMRDDIVKSVLGKQKGDTAKKRKRDNVVPRGDVNFVSAKEMRNVKVRGEGFSRCSSRFTVAKRSSVVKKRDDIEIIFIGKPNEIEEVTVNKNYRPSKIVENKRPSKIVENKRPSKTDDGRNIEYLRKSKKQCDKPDRRLYLTRTDHVSDPIDIVGKAKRHRAVLSRESAKYQRKTPGNKQRDLVVQQSDYIENSRFSSGTGNMDVMVEEIFDDCMNVVLVEKSKQMIQGRDGVYDNNLRKWYKCDEKCGMYAVVKVKNATSLNYEEHNEHSPDLEILRKSKKQHKKLERRPCLTRANHLSDPTDIAGKSKRRLTVLSRQNAKYRRASPRNEQRNLVVQQGGDIVNSRSSSGTGNMDVMVKEEKFDDSTNVDLVKKSMQMIPGRDGVYDNNVRPQNKCDKKFGKYTELKEENAKSLNYDEEDNEDSPDIEILEMDNQKHLSKFEVMKVFNDVVVEDDPLTMNIPDNKTSVFREELMDILRKPFNQEEYRSLMHNAKYRHLNWGPEYSDGLKGKEEPNTYGKSPLDHHPDVQRRLRRCRRISKRLNILRGFLYWYGKTCQDGAFKPWLDRSCLAVTPSPR